MEAGLLTLGSLFGLGHYLNEKNGGKQKRIEPYTPPVIHDNEKPVAENIYEQHEYEKVEGENGIMRKLADDRFRKALDTAKTLIVPRYYNTINAVASGQEENPEFDSDAIYMDIDYAQLQREMDSKFGSGKKLVPYFAQEQPPEGNLFSNGNIQMAEYSEAFPSELAGTVVEGVTHNNMVPFISKVTQNLQLDDRYDSKLEAFTGNFKLKRSMKTEVERDSLFRPEKDLSYVYGMPVIRQLDRVIPSQLGKRNNDLPFEQTRVGPGLNKGYTAEPSGGYHPRIRIMPKTSENLYVNPRTHKDGRIIAGKRPNDAPMLIGAYIKNKPDNTTENVNGERNLRTTGVYIFERKRPETIVMKEQSRGEKKDGMFGPMAPVTRKTQLPDGYREQVSYVFKSELGGTPYRNLGQIDGGRLNDFGKSGIIRKANERDTTGSRSELIARAGMVNMPTSHFIGYNIDGDSASTSTNGISKTQIEGFGADINSSSGTINIKVGEGIPRTTIREETGKTDYVGIVGTETTNPRIYRTDQNPNRATHRETTGKTDYNGIVKTDVSKQRIYKTDQNPNRTTHRETTGKTDYNGIVKTEVAKQRIYKTDQNPNRTTHRETTGKTDYNGIVKTEVAKQRIYKTDQNPNKTTHRETTGHTENFGVVKTETARPRIYKTDQNPNKTTHRETTGKTDYVGAMNSDGSGIRKHRIYLTDKNPNKTTHRETTGHTEHYGPMESERPKMMDRSSMLTAPVNVVKEKLKKLPSQTPVGAQRMNHFVNWEVKKMDYDRINDRSLMKTSIYGNRFEPTTSRLTVTKNRVDEEPDRLKIEQEIKNQMDRNSLATDVSKVLLTTPSEYIVGQQTEELVQ
jgi:hypothetical protein